MPGPSRDVRMRLFRDSPITPWGFRVHGGTDLGRPLTVQKTNLGSPSDGELCSGDVILEIQDCDASTMTHQKVQELIRNSGGSLLLRVRRFAGSPDPHSAPTSQIATGNLPGQSCIMMHRIQDTLANLGTGPSASASSSLLYDPSPTDSTYHLLHHDRFYQRSSPAMTLECRGGKPQSFHDSLYSTLPRLKNLSQPPKGLEEPGWAPAGPRTHQATSQGRHNPPPPPPSVRSPDRPAWEGSLRSAIDPRLTDTRVQLLRPTKGEEEATAASRGILAEIVRFPPGRSDGGGGGWGAPGAEDPRPRRLLRCNSPMDLQSTPSANETLFRQSKSEVYSLVRQFDRNRNASKMDRKAFDVFTDF